MENLSTYRATEYHNSLRDYLIVLLLPFVKQRKLGKIISEQDFEFDGNAHGPDVSFIGAAKLHLIERKRRVQRFVPDMAIEIVSGNDTFNSLMGKVIRYRRCGTTEVWILARYASGVRPIRRTADRFDR